MLGYCVRCRAKKEMLAPTRTVMKNNRRAMIGQCACCGTKMCVAGVWDDDAPAVYLPEPRLQCAAASAAMSSPRV